LVTIAATRIDTFNDDRTTTQTLRLLKQSAVCQGDAALIARPPGR
jgi:hypothetical protein